MSTLAVVEEILRETAIPMSVREIVERAGTRLPSKSKTPDTVVARDLAMDIKKKGETSLFTRTSPGRYTLRTIAAARSARAGRDAPAAPVERLAGNLARKPPAAAGPAARPAGPRLRRGWRIRRLIECRGSRAEVTHRAGLDSTSRARRPSLDRGHRRGGLPRPRRLHADPAVVARAARRARMDRTKRPGAWPRLRDARVLHRRCACATSHRGPARARGVTNVPEPRHRHEAAAARDRGRRARRTVELRSRICGSPSPRTTSVRSGSTAGTGSSIVDGSATYDRGQRALRMARSLSRR